MKTPVMKKLNMPDLMNAASALALEGTLAISNNKLVYLNIDDAYIHRLFPFFQHPEIKKPDYFGAKSAGAHVTVMYPEEGKVVDGKDLGKAHGFLIKELVAAEIGAKVYYALLVESQSLLEVRRKYQLPDLLCFKGYGIGFHITVGVKLLVPGVTY